ncbi:short-chain dehydrogenase [Bacillus alkalicellulosilyticus]|uniref:short-chain dehydrogenase n=1 Tax=Alkalihalobacterium alkalicellulosilyticum TaxID=1912214 RepID=UPI001FE52AE0|nr:short-chain dehydrogenase [Bacillus alkalicellulosilyticus]
MSQGCDIMLHALVIGGTGMLSNVSLWLVSEGYNVSVIGRTPKRMERLISASQDTSKITPLLVDYRYEAELKEKLGLTIQKNGPVDLVIAWIHSGEKKVIDVLSKLHASDDLTWKLFHVLGSSSNVEQIKNTVKVPNNCLYKQIQLGFIIEDTHSRWLTHDEISAGVIEAISNDNCVTIVGTLFPWDKRP